MNKNRISTAALKTTGMISLMILLVFVINGIVNPTHPVTQAQSAEPGIMQFLPQKHTELSEPPRLIAMNNPTVAVTTPHEDLEGIMGQINSVNAAILSTMRECINIANTAEDEVNAMREDEKQLKEEISDINDELSNIDSSDPDRVQKRADLVDRRDELNAERSSILRSISERKNQYNNDRRECQKSLSAHQKEKRLLENQINRAYTNASRATFN